MKFLLVILCAISIFGCASSNNRSSTGNANEIVSYGVFETIGVETKQSSKLVAGKVHLVDSFKLIDKTQKVPGKLGTTFGIAYKLGGSGTIAIEEVIIFPGKGLTNPKSGISTTADVEKLSVSSDGQRYFTYSLDAPWEAKTGEWAFQVKKEGAVILEQKFHVQ